MPKTILITGATGFVGKRLLRAFEQTDFRVVVAVRTPDALTDLAVEKRLYRLNTQDPLFLSDIDCVIHLAGMAHNRSISKSTLIEVNGEGTKKLAELAAAQGVKRFIYLSSIGVNGNKNDTPFDEASPVNPHNDYALSKFLGEQALEDVSARSHMQAIIIRAPLIYGAQAKGSFNALTKLVQSGLPIPFASIKNNRSLCSVSNLCDFVVHCVCIPKKNQMNKVERVVIADNNIVSTSQIVSEISSALRKPDRQFSFPTRMISLLFHLINKPELANGLLHDLTVDNRYARTKFKWVPKQTIYDELTEIQATVPSGEQSLKSRHECADNVE